MAALFCNNYKMKISTKTSVTAVEYHELSPSEYFFGDLLLDVLTTKNYALCPVYTYNKRFYAYYQF